MAFAGTALATVDGAGAPGSFASLSALDNAGFQSLPAPPNTELFASVPEPGSTALMVSGMLAVGMLARRRRP